ALVLLGLAVVLGRGGPSPAGDLYSKDPAASQAVALPKPAEVQTLSVYPDKIALKGGDDAMQLIVTAQLAGRLQDLSGDPAYAVADPKVCRVTGSGRVVPLGNGSTEITATYGDKSVKVP